MARNKSPLRYPRKAKFSLADCIALNATLNAQTVRTLVRQAISDGEVLKVGTIPTGGRGRPSFVLALA